MITMRRTMMLALLPLAAACGGSPDPSTDGLGAAGPSSSSGGSVGTFGDAGGASDNGKTCAADKECDDGDACTQDACVGATTKEIQTGRCTHAKLTTPACSGDTGDSTDAGPDTGTSTDPCAKNPSDPACKPPEYAPPVCTQGPSTFPAFVALHPPDVPGTCANGFELNNPSASDVYAIRAKTAGGAAAITLDVDFASYLVPDGIMITATDARGVITKLLDTSQIQTWTSSDPTDGFHRPPDDTIRQYHVAVPQGTEWLGFDFRCVNSPTYMRVVGLCGFDVLPFAAVPSWRTLP